MAERLDFVVTDATEATALAAVQGLAPQFTLHIGPKRVTQRTWLDTFDWRLHRAGLVLEHSETSGETSLTLTSKDGERLVVPATTARWPALVDELSEDAIRERLAAVVGIRALAAVADGRSTVHRIDLLNDDAKTVARVLIDRPTARRRSADPVSTFLSVLPVRGYVGEARRAAAVVSGAPGVELSTRSVYEEALDRADRQPQRYVTKSDLSLLPSMGSAAAVAAVLETFLAVMQTNVSGVIADIDTEFLHDFRVAVRRTRATLKLVGNVLPDELAERMAPEFKWLGDLTTPTRDLDVFLLGFAPMAGGVHGGVAALGPFRKHLIRQRGLAQRKLVRGLRSQRFETLIADWAAALADILSTPSSSAAPPIGEFADQAVSHAYKRVAKHGSRITADSPAEDLHTLRKRCKELRYLLEIFSSLQEESAHRRVLRELKALQEVLGDFQDGAVQQEAIRTFATEMMDASTAPAETLLAMGQLAAELEEGQSRARDEYSDRFARFMRPKNRTAMAHLSASGTTGS